MLRAFLRECLTKGTAPNKFFTNKDFAPLAKEVGQLLTKLRVSVKAYSRGQDITFPVELLLAEFKKKCDRGADLETAMQDFLAGFQWTDAFVFSVYTRHPPIQGYTVEKDFPTTDDLNKIPAHLREDELPTLGDKGWKKLLSLKFAFQYDDIGLRGNPLNLLGAFSLAHSMGLYPPLWVLKPMAEIFKIYGDARGTKSLDVLFGLKPSGKGKKLPAFKAWHNHERDTMLTRDVYCLETFCGFSVDQACKIVAVKLQKSKNWDHTGSNLRTVSPGKLKQIYYDQWRSYWQKAYKEDDSAARYFKNKKNKAVFLGSFPYPLGPAKTSLANHLTKTRLPTSVI